MLNNPINALRTFEKNWARVAQLALIITYTIFIIFDTFIIMADALSCEGECRFVERANTMLEFVQGFLNATILLAYAILFVWFAMMISRN